MVRQLQRVSIVGLVAISLLGAPSSRAAIGAQLVVATSWPAAFVFDPGGRIFYGNRFTGEIRIFNPATGGDTLFFALPDVATVGEQGLLGLALHPSYPARPYIFAYYTRTVDGQPENQIVQLTDSMGTDSGRSTGAGPAGQGFRTLLSLPAAGNHNGGVIHFGPDNELYAVVGDVGNRANAQDLSSFAGKVLRISGISKPLPLNRLGCSPICAFAFGIRNSFGFAFDPQTGNLWQTENGPACNDELNRIVEGGNHAWGPSETCNGTPPQNTNQDGPAPRILPRSFYNPVIAPTGAAFCQGCGLGAAIEGRLLFGDWNRGEIHAVTLTADRLGVASQTVILDRPSGILAVERGTGGAIYFSDANGIYRLTGP
jgi:glucose/arabinose dehydrogenase